MQLQQQQEMQDGLLHHLYLIFYAQSSMFAVLRLRTSAFGISVGAPEAARSSPNQPDAELPGELTGEPAGAEQ